MATFAQFFLAVVFLGAAIGKASDPTGFLRILASINWLPLRLARIATWGIPGFEAGLAIALIVIPAWGAVAAFVAFSAFSVVVLVERAAGRDFTCGCFGNANAREATSMIFVRNAVISAAVIPIITTPAVSEPGAVLTGVGVGFAFLLAEFSAASLRRGRR